MCGLSYSPSELDTYNECPLKHEYRYHRRLDLIGEAPPTYLASGRAVHDLVEHCLHAMSPITENVVVRALYNAHVPRDSRVELLDEPFNPDPYEKAVKRLVAGVTRAVEKVPTWIWESEWNSETPIEAQVVSGVDMHGRPDLWRVVEDDLVSMVDIVDIKTTESDPHDYILWNPQLRLYALMLKRMYPDHVIQYRYVCVPTTTKKARESAPYLFTNAAFTRTANYVKDTVRKLEAPGLTIAREGRHCNFCSYEKLCKTWVTGGNVDEAIRDFYEARP